MKKSFRKKFSRTTFTIIFTIITGILIGIFSTNTIDKKIYEVHEVTKNYLQLFLNAFSLNYWYFFILWFLGLIPLGFFLSYFITFFKSFMIGVTLGICLKSSAIFGTKIFISYALFELLIIIPLLTYVAKKSIHYSLVGRNSFNENGTKYFKVLVKTTIFIIIYAILVAIRMTILEAI